MKKILTYFMVAFVIVMLAALPVAADESGSVGTETFAVTEAVQTEAAEMIGSEEASEIIDIIESAETKSDAILAVAQKLGITVEEAENIINTFLSLGDEYLGEEAWWGKLKGAVNDDMQFWTVAIVAGAAVLSIIGMIFVLLAKINPNTRAAKANTKQAVIYSEEIAKAYSQTLANMEEMYAKALEKEEIFEKMISAKEEKILLLEEAYNKEHNAVMTALSCALRVQKLICDRTAMPMTDKATVDNFYSKGVDALKSDLDEIAAEELIGVLAILDKVGGKNG